MPENNPRYILANGERFVVPAPQKKGFGSDNYPWSFEEARDRIKTSLLRSVETLRAIPKSKRFPDEQVLCFRMHPDTIAKSYDPEVIFARIPTLMKVGSRNYRLTLEETKKTTKLEKSLNRNPREFVQSRLVFARGSETDFQFLVKLLDRRVSEHTKNFINEIRCIDRVDTLTEEEQLHSFGLHPEWKKGRVELVFHPSQHTPEEQLNFLTGLFPGGKGRFDNCRYMKYPSGPLFVSTILERDELPLISGANPLRAARPLEYKRLEQLRSSGAFRAPIPPQSESRSSIKVGIFDGGIDEYHPLLRHHVEHDESLSINAPADSNQGIPHGTAVAGTVLYGPLNSYKATARLPDPPVSVVSFRALPTSDSQDHDLYESIDVIENVIPTRKDISVYNLSLGPAGPIDDDSISRFTYALDYLACKYNVTFCVAVGNDGDQPFPYDRIQAPSDMVNGLGIGAYSDANGIKYVAPYSCKGPGRECAKVKPDLFAFGGCEQKPIHLLSLDYDLKALTYGTSFSCPSAASLIAQVEHGIERGSALLSRVILIHNSKVPERTSDNSFGNGIIPNNLESLLACDENEVSILFQGSIFASHRVKLPFLLPENIVSTGKLRFRWTVGIQPEIDPSQVSEYTKVCIHEAFYPNEHKFAFRPPKGSVGQKERRLHIQNERSTVENLLDQNWKMSNLPLSESSKNYLCETELRQDMKWEPLVRKWVNKNVSSVEQPFLVLHAVPRNGFSGSVDYAAVLSITPTENVDLYQAVVRNSPALQPVRLKSQSEIRVQVRS